MADLNTNVVSNDTLVQSRATTFIDSYIYMKNIRYNALYEKDQEILQLEKNALETKSCDVLYSAAFKQTESINSLIVRMKNFVQKIRFEVTQNISALFPDYNEIKDFEEAINFGKLPKQKFVSYKVNKIQYPNMSSFPNYMNREIDNLFQDKETLNISKPFDHLKASDFLIGIDDQNSESLLREESFKIITLQDLIKIKNILKQKNAFITTIDQDFRIFYFYLRQYKILQNCLSMIEPVGYKDKVFIGPRHLELKEFNDYLILYKHYTIIIKQLIDEVSKYEAKFFNKIYAIQSNIEVYRSIIEYYVSYYKTQMRNNDNAISEAFEDVGSLVSGQDAVRQFITADAVDFDIPNDEMQDGSEPEVSLEPEDVFDQEYDSDEYYDGSQINDDGHLVQPEPVDYDYQTAAVDYLHRMDEAYSFIDNVFMSDFTKKTFLNEADEAKKTMKEVLQSIVDNIKQMDAKFKESIKGLIEENAVLIEQATNLDFSSVDLSGIEFEMYDYPKGVEIMHALRIPVYKPDDDDILKVGDGIAYKQKYFKDIYYFNQNGVPLNRNKFRGSMAKRKLKEDKIDDVFKFFLKYVNSYVNLTKTMTNANNRIMSAFLDQEKSIDDSYGETEEITEAIAVNRSMYFDKIYKLMLEADEEIPEEQQSEEKVSDEKPIEEINVDDSVAEEANTKKNYTDALRMYCKITYEVNSTRMDVYEEIFETAFQFFKLMVDSVNGSDNTVEPEENEAAPVENPAEETEQVEEPQEETEEQQVE